MPYGYQLRDASTGLFGTAGRGWSERGKVWTRPGDLKNHIHWFKRAHRYDPIDTSTWEIVITELAPVEAGRMSLEEFLAAPLKKGKDDDEVSGPEQSPEGRQTT